ncbi:MAG TPA: GNAT family N-acetyltransferase [Thermosynechococcaceae cyanobacterium]
MLQIRSELEASREDKECIVEMLRQFNRGFIASPGWQNMAVAREAGTIAGVAVGEIGHGCLHIDSLVVREDLRGKGVGSELLRVAEAEGRKQNCVGAYLETTDFQARGFYERQGYHIFGTQENFPIGHTRYFMQKLFP